MVLACYTDTVNTFNKFILNTKVENKHRNNEYKAGCHYNAVFGSGSNAYCVKQTIA